jgi:CO/xanthine dehydrogenase FAD-binding subunit
MGDYLRPKTLTAALEALAERPLRVLAGGTDYYPARQVAPSDEDILDITAIAALKRIEDKGDHWRIGALATWSDAIAADLPPLFDGLKAAAREIGGRQIQNAATIAGNLCNASPAADGAPCLLALDAAVELASRTSKAVVPLAKFLRGNRDTLRRADQLVTAIVVPRPNGAAAGGFVKLGARAYLVISIVSVAAVLEVDLRRRLRGARIAVGSCAPTALRLPELEKALIGRPCDGALADAPAPAHFAALAPIDDLRASAAYRRDAAATLTRRLLGDLGRRLGAER